jgi:hypothetical protein
VASGGNRSFDEKRLEELIVYVALKSEGSRYFGRTKLVKLLFFSDFEAFRRLGRSITGATYRKLDFGPVPSEFQTAVLALKSSSSVAERSAPVHQYDQKQVVALREADLSLFSAAEIAIVDDFIFRFWDTNAREISDLTHQQPGWRLAEMGDVIPYETVVLPERQRDLSPEELAWARQSVKSIHKLGR